MVTNENTALALVPKSNTISIAAPNIPSMAEIDALNAMCKIAAYSGFLNSTSSDPAKRAADAFFVMMYGRELGIPAMTALKTIHVIDGKPSCSGQALLALMKRGGVEVKVPDPGSVSNSASVQVRRPGGDWKTYTYTMDMARKAGLENKKNWKASPAEMLIWRAVSTAARFEVPDIVGGLYTIEELQPDMPVNEQGELVDTPMITVTTPPPAVEAPAHNPENGPSEPEAEPEATKSEQSVQAGVPPQNVVDGSAGTDDGNSPDAQTVDMPDDLFKKLMQDKDIGKASKAYEERAATIRKLWAEGAITVEQDEFDRVMVVIERLQSHRKEGAK